MKLTDEEWTQVFKLRCRSKLGLRTSEEEQALVDAAWREDPERYAAMAPDVFDATVPFGSSAKARRTNQ